MILNVLLSLLAACSCEERMLWQVQGCTAKNAMVTWLHY